MRGGLTLANVEWALTSGDAANWFPLTRLSHLVDSQLFGLRAGPQHLSSVLWHALAAVLLFLFLERATHAHWPSAWAAFIFALHPLHVESVAWVAERKDVLCAFFWFLALWAYARYAARPSLGRYLAVLLWFSLGLVSKPMIVTLPFLLLILDFWPLGRLTRAAVREKIPFFALAAISAGATLAVQQASGAVKEVARLPVGLRVENAVVSYAMYCLKTVWPSDLAVFYPYPSGIDWWVVAAAALALTAITVLAFRLFRSAPYLTAGWLWFMIALAPVIGLVQVGAQARADRYMYVPMVGLTIMLAWGTADLVRRLPGIARPVAAAGIVTCLVAGAVSAAQIEYWRNSETLFQHALDVTQDNYLAEHNLGSYLLANGRIAEAILHLEAALRIRPESAPARSDLASALAQSGRLPEAIAQYQAAIRLLPDSAILHHNLASALARFPERLPEAIGEYRTALRLDPDYAEAHNNLGLALAATGRVPEAIAEYRAALRLNADYAEAHYNLGVALSKSGGRLAEAIAEFEAALRLKPDYAEAHNNLGVVLSQMPGRSPEAIAHFEAALRLLPDYADAHYNLGVALSQLPGRTAEAIAHLDEAYRLQPDPELRRAIDRLRAGR